MNEDSKDMLLAIIYFSIPLVFIFWLLYGVRQEALNTVYEFNGKEVRDCHVKDGGVFSVTYFNSRREILPVTGNSCVSYQKDK